MSLSHLYDISPSEKCPTLSLSPAHKHTRVYICVCAQKCVKELLCVEGRLESKAKAR